MIRLLKKIQVILKSPSKKSTLLDLSSLLFYSLACFSIPTCSFVSQLKFLTWGFTIVFIILMCLTIFFVNKELMFDFVSGSLLLFAISSTISSVLNGMNDFSFTALLMTISTFVVYSYTKNNIRLKNFLFGALYLATLLFLMVFIFVYFYELSHFKFDRLGNVFGNVNDVAIFLGLGTSFSVYYALNSKKVFFKLLNGLSAFLFAYCGLSTGTKILIISFAVTFLATIITHFGAKKWYISLIVIFSMGFIAFISLNLPVFATIKNRFLSMINTFFGNQDNNGTFVDYSSIDRFHMFCNGIEMVLRKPLFGYGFHGFHNFSSFGKSWSHNNFSESLACFGVLGAVLYYYPFVASLIGIMSKNKRNSLSFVVLLFFFVCMFSFAFDVQKLFSFTIGIVYASLAESREIKKVNLNILLTNREKVEK